MKGTHMIGLGILLFGSSVPLAAQGGLNEANDWLSGTVIVTSDYAFRGISQTLEKPAIQGGIELAHPSGFYLGTWGSSLNFGEEVNPRAQVEMDVYGGFGFAPANLPDVDLGVTYYGYPGAQARDYAFLEFGAGLSRSFSLLTAAITTAYSPDFFASSGQAWHYGLDLSVPLSLFTLNGALGHQRIEHNEIFSTPDYTHWSLGLAVGVAGFEVSGAYLGSNLESAQCFGGAGLCGGRTIVALSRAM